MITSFFNLKKPTEFDFSLFETIFEKYVQDKSCINLWVEIDKSEWNLIERNIDCINLNMSNFKYTVYLDHFNYNPTMFMMKIVYTR